MFNDPSAGSPTDALLRLLFPLNNYIRISLMIKFLYLCNIIHIIPYTHIEIHW